MSCIHKFLYLTSDVFRPFGRPVSQFECPNSGTQKTLFNFFFQLYFNKVYVEIAISDFTMYLVLKWLRIQKCKQKRKTMRLKVEAKEETVNKSVFIHLTTQ